MSRPSDSATVGGDKRGLRRRRFVSRRRSGSQRVGSSGQSSSGVRSLPQARSSSQRTIASSIRSSSFIALLVSEEPLHPFQSRHLAGGHFDFGARCFHGAFFRASASETSCSPAKQIRRKRRLDLARVMGILPLFSGKDRMP